jgi:hypothetical protein
VSCSVLFLFWGWGGLSQKVVVGKGRSGGSFNALFAPACESHVPPDNAVRVRAAETSVKFGHSPW